MVLSLDHTSSYFLPFASIFLHAQFLFLHGGSLGKMSDPVRSVIQECKGLNSPDPVRKARGGGGGGVRLLLAKLHQGPPTSLFFFLEIPALMCSLLVFSLFHVPVVSC